MLVERLAPETAAAKDRIDLRGDAHDLKARGLRVSFEDGSTEVVQVIGLIFRDGNAASPNPTNGILRGVGKAGEHKIQFAEQTNVALFNAISH